MSSPQHDLFGADDSDVSASDRMLRIAAAPRQPLRKPQRGFNHLVAQVRKLRQELADWQAAIERYRERVAGELAPLRRELWQEQRAAALWLDALLASRDKADRLSRHRRETLRGLIADLADAILAEEPDAEVEAIFDRHSAVSRQDLRDLEMDLAETVIGDAFGDESIAGHQASSPDELLDHVRARLQAEQEAAAQQRQARAEARRSRGAGPSRAEAAAERRAQAEREASRSVREVFRRLAGSLHPDREPDSEARTHKTALMKRVNQAYERGDLLELLTIQIEIEQIDAEHLAQATDQRLSEYCAVLRGQRQALQDELAQCRMPLLAALDDPPPPRAMQPALFDRLVEQDLDALRTALEQLRRDIAAMREPAQRAATIDALAAAADEDEDAELAMLDLLLMAAEAPPPRPRSASPRRKRKAKPTRRR